MIMNESSTHFNFYKTSFGILSVNCNAKLYALLIYPRSIQITQPNLLKILVIIDGAEILVSLFKKSVPS